MTTIERPIIALPALSYDLKTAAAVTGLSKTHLERAVNAGQLKAKRSSRDDEGDPVGKRVVLASDLQAYLEALPDD